MNEREPWPTNVFDALIIGSGATGCWASKRLTEAGLHVCLIEAGPKKLLNGPLAGNNRTEDYHVQARCSAFKDKVRQPYFLNDRENPYSTPPDAPFNWFRASGLGGRLNIWSRHVPRISDTGFLSLDNDEAVWPLCYQDLGIHYGRIEDRLGVYGEPNGLSICPDGQFLSPVLPSSELAREIRANLTDTFPGLAITAGRLVRHNPNNLPLPLVDALRTGRLSTHFDTIGTMIDASRKGKTARVAVIDRHSRLHGELSAKIILLAASAFESVRLLFRSSCFGGIRVGKANDVLGHYISDHVFCTTGGCLSPEQGKRAQLNAPLTFDRRDFGDTTFYLPGVTASHGQFKGRYGIQLVIAPRGQPTWSAAAFGEMVPNYENHVRLDESLRDAWDLAGLFIECRHRDNEMAMALQMQRHMSLIAKAVGLEEQQHDYGDRRKYLPHGALVPGSAVHEVGGARMGTSPANSVVNSYGQCWANPKLFVIDGASFPSLPFQNPTLTMMALADRACDFISENWTNF